MNDNQAKRLCQQFKLGELISEPRKIASNTLHDTWLIETPLGHFAIKELNLLIPGDKRLLKYEATEKISRTFATNSIQTVISLTHQGNALTEIEGIHFIVYPWIKGRSLDESTVSPAKAAKVASVLAHLHQLNLSFSEIEETTWFVHSNEVFKLMTEKALHSKLPFAEDLHASLELIFDLNHNFQQSVDRLRMNTVISHGDLHPKNVIWTSDNQFFLIDWESAGRYNPAQEIITTALNWSGVASLALNEEIFETMLSSYKDAAGNLPSNLDFAFYGDIGIWLDWLFYNINQSLQEDPKKERNCLKHIKLVTKALSVLHYINANLRNWIGRTK